MMDIFEKKLSSFTGADDYGNNFDVDVFVENDIAFFINKDTNSYFIFAQLSGTEEDGVDYTAFRKNSEGLYEEWDGGIIDCHKTTCLQVADLLGFSGISDDELKDIHPENIIFVETDNIRTITAFEISKNFYS